MSKPEDFVVDLYFEKCIEYQDRRKIIVVEDTKKKAADQKEKPKYRIENPNGNLVAKIVIDGCLFLPDTKPQRCDYLILVQLKTNEKVAYFVELKGKDLETAIEQIQETIKNTHQKLPNFSLRCRISQSKMQPIIATNQHKERFIKYLYKQYGSNTVNVKQSELVKIERTPLKDTI